ncbi:MAG TPA: molybdopterin biosynthesis protein [Clostridiales bacterium]|nr:molybdopterin biosynthesis protein [Clostridiales bacterium]
MKEDNKRNVYIGNTDIKEAIKLYSEKLNIDGKPKWEKVNPWEAYGRITWEGVFAKYSSPNYNASAMDGIAVKYKKTLEATETNPVRLKKDEDYKIIDTGDPIREPFNSVIMIEDVVQIDENTVEIISPAFPWQHVRQIGEDIVAGEMIVPSKHKLRPVDIGGIISGGVEKVKVYKKPKVGIIPTGTEIVDLGKDLEEGDIIESNSRIFQGLVLKYGGEPNRYQPVVDDYNLIKEAVQKSVEENEVTIINAGSSAGTEDYTRDIIAELGEVVVHGLAIKPGKPAILGIVNDKPVIGIPGYPVSAYFVFENIAREIIKKYLGELREEKKYIKATLSRRIVSNLKQEEYVRIKLGKVDNNIIATPLKRGAGVTMSLINADGVLTIPKEYEGIEKGETVEIELMTDIKNIENTIVSIGSHDLIIDLIRDELHRKYPEYSISSAHTGSMGGIMALRNGETHIAPIHLLDEKSGEYNEAFIKKYFKGRKIAYIKGVKRQQGLIVQKGNPREIKEFKDIGKEDLVFINRQKGSGTRILTDYLIKENSMDRSQVIGYDREGNTHMAVSSAVASGTADVGIGVYSAAQIMDNDFIGITEEEYDFALDAELLEDEKIKKFISILKDENFRKRLEKLGGYNTESSGEVGIYEG